MQKMSNQNKNAKSEILSLNKLSTANPVMLKNMKIAINAIKTIVKEGA